MRVRHLDAGDFQELSKKMMRKLVCLLIVVTAGCASSRTPHFPDNSVAVLADNYLKSESADSYREAMCAYINTNPAKRLASVVILDADARPERGLVLLKIGMVVDQSEMIVPTIDRLLSYLSTEEVGAIRYEDNLGTERAFGAYGSPIKSSKDFLVSSNWPRLVDVACGQTIAIGVVAATGNADNVEKIIWRLPGRTYPDGMGWSESVGSIHNP